MEFIIQQGVLEVICEGIKFKEARYVAVSLEALANLLEFGKRYYTIDGKNQIVKMIENLGLFDVLESLQYHPSQTVYDRCSKLLESYFDTYYEAE